MRRITLAVVVVVVAAAVWPSWESSARSAEPASNAQGDKAAEDDQSDTSLGLGGILKAGGPVGVLIILLSIGAVALVIEHAMTIREGVLMPPGMADEVRELLGQGKLGPAQQRCRTEPSFLSHVLEAGLAEADVGWPAVEKAVEDAAADQSARLFRKIEYLSVIGNIAPMLGLLGTVIGMIFAFQKVATASGPVVAADLAEGIYLALITTVLGLIVAIPSLAAFAWFRNRVDQLVAETSYTVQHVFAPIKRTRTARAPQGPLPPAPPPTGGR